MADFVGELNRLAGTKGLEAAGAANIWAGTTGKELVGALNVKAGTTGLELLGAVNKIAGTSGLDLVAALSSITSAYRFSDSFDRADNATTMGVTDSAFGGVQAAWAPQSGTWGIKSNKAYLVSATANATTVIQTGLADCTLELKYSSDAIAHGHAYRSTDSTNYFCIQANGAFRVEAGGFNSKGDPGAIADGDIIKVVLSGNTHTIFNNGVQVLQFTDSFQATATKHGLRINSDATVTFPDNYKVSV